MKLMHKDEIIETYVKIMNKIIDDLMLGRDEFDIPDTFAEATMQCLFFDLPAI